MRVASIAYSITWPQSPHKQKGENSTMNHKDIFLIRGNYFFYLADSPELLYMSQFALLVSVDKTKVTKKQKI